MLVTVRVLVAPDSFKGTFSAPRVADALAAGLERAGATVDHCPVADGGEGTLEVILAAHGGRLESIKVLDPLGREVKAAFGVIGSTAVVEIAAASGLSLLSEKERNPWAATSYGTGQLIYAASQAARNVVVAVGGSATVDGGRGALKALSHRGGVGRSKLIVLFDVTTTWERCAAVYGPQKGADPQMVARLSARLRAFARRLPRDPRGVVGGGAGGGMAGGLWAAFGGELEPGATYVLNMLKFDSRLREVDAVVCGEGQLDSQSGEGKIVGEIAARAAKAGVPVHAVVGHNDLSEDEIDALGLASVSEARTIDKLKDAGAKLAAALTPA
jgi:glycerate kinase